MSTELKSNHEEDSHGRETPLVSFCQLLRRLQIESGKRVGYDLPPTEEPVRLRCDLTATFPINELAHWYADRQTLEVSFFGMFGASGALPQHYTQKMIELRSREGDFTHARLSGHVQSSPALVLLSRLGQNIKRWRSRMDPRRRLAQKITSPKHCGPLIGLRCGESGLVGTQSLAPYQTQLSYTFAVSSQAHQRATAEGLRVTLQHTFQLKTRDSTVCGSVDVLSNPKINRAWSVRPVGYRFWFAVGREHDCGQPRLGLPKHKFSRATGPSLMAEIPGPDAHQADFETHIADFVRQSVGPQYDFDIQIAIDKETVPPRGSG